MDPEQRLPEGANKEDEQGQQSGEGARKQQQLRTQVGGTHRAPRIR